MQSGSPSIAAVILAAGRSGRMGRCKALLDIGGQSALERICGNLRAAGIERQIIVTGHHHREIHAAMPQGEYVYNTDYADGGMISSVKVGVAAINDKCHSMMIALVDHPFVDVRTIAQIIQASIFHPNKIVRPRYDGKMGHPVLIPGAYADSIHSMPGNATLKTWMMEREQNIHIVDVDDAGIRIDLDTQEDYEKAKKRCESLKA
ncbi:MAG TPA: nucleotidyltransferase family protein [Tepidisphaeraceae bacterium]|jgi:molybdenum cofactor cytidylyltransferase